MIAHLLRLDLPHRIVFANRPADDPLFWLFHDPRAAKLMALREETWLRIADVEQALAARSYGHADPVVLAVDDALLPENTRTIRLSSQSVEQSNEAPQAKVDISSLAAAYLGAAKWWQLQQAGRVWAEDAEVIGRLDALFAAPAQPHSGTMF